MKLERLILVNWGQMRPGNYEIGGMTLLTGETGSGKSTMLDAVQTVMTAAYKGMLSYNSAQDEVQQSQRRGKTKRNVESYVVGAEYSKFSRPEGAQGYLAAVFRPEPNEDGAKLFTAVIAASARVDGSGETRQAKQESFSMFLVDDAVLTYEDFMVDPERGKCVATEQIGRRLKGKYPRVLEFHDKKMDYLCALYGRFRGKPSVTRDEAFNAGKAWVQSIAYKPIGSVHELVRDEILDFDARQLQQDIERISGLMKEVSNLRKEGQRLQTSVKLLDNLSTALTKTTMAHEGALVHDLFTARLKLKLDDEQVAACDRTIAEASTKADKLNAEIAARKLDKDRLTDQQIEISARMLGIPGLQQKQDYEGRIANASRDARKVLRKLQEALVAAGLLDQRAQHIVEHPVVEGFADINERMQAVAEAYAKTPLDGLSQHLQSVTAALSADTLQPSQLTEIAEAFSSDSRTSLNTLFQALVGVESSLLLTLNTQLTLLDPRVTQANAAVTELDSQIATLAKGEVPYPPAIQLAVSRIRERYPEANVQVLCDVVEPASAGWQPAIEGYLGGARYNLIVDTKWEAKVLDFARERNLNVKVIQGSLCLENMHRRQLPEDSIVHELRSENQVAWAYLVDQYGPVIKVENSEALRRTSRGLTKDGKGAGSRTMFAVEEKKLVFGTAARAAQLESVKLEREAAKDRASSLTSTKETLTTLNRHLVGLKEPVFDAVALDTHAAEIEQAQQGLATLDLHGVEELKAALDDVKTQLSDLEVKDNNARDDVTRSEEAIKNNSEEKQSLANRRLSLLDALDSVVARVKSLTQVNSTLAYNGLSDKAAALLNRPGVTLAVAQGGAEQLPKPEAAFYHALEALSAFHLQCRSDEMFPDALAYGGASESFDASYARAVRLLESVDARLKSLRSIGLYNNQLELENAVKSFNDVFTKNFCVDIKDRVDEGIKTLRQMNKELENLKFGQDKFTIDWSRWEPELKEYLEFFAAVTQLTESSESLDLFGDNELSGKHVEIRDRLVALLLADDQERASKELLRIADYRNYRRYDIFNDSDSGGRIRLSQWGTGSGGQLETPAYIVRAAVVTNRLRIFEKGPSLKLLVNDESFSRMDEARARAVLEFLRDKLNLQIISAMPTRSTGAFKDEFSYEYSFTRLSPVENGELDFTTECDERVLKTDKMRELWEQQRQLAREKAKRQFDLAEPEFPGLVEPAEASAHAEGVVQ